MSKRTRKNTKTAEQRQAERQAQADALHARLVDQVEDLRRTEVWSAFLRAAAAFHTYSLNNVLLILAQRPDATAVAGFRQWQARGRQVRRGEKAIKIFGYSTRTVTQVDDETEEETERRIARFPILSVFAIEQTDPIEGTVDPGLTAPVAGDDVAGVWDAMTAHLTGQGWTVEREPLAGGLNGYTDATDRRVVVGEHLDGAHAARCLLHEAAHATLHAELEPGQYREHRGTYETEAESTAYVLAGLAGLDTSAYSVGYVAGWANADVEVLRATAENVMRAVRALSPALTDRAAHDAA